MVGASIRCVSPVGGSAPEDAGGVGFDLLEDHVDGLVADRGRSTGTTCCCGPRSRASRCRRPRSGAGRRTSWSTPRARLARWAGTRGWRCSCPECDGLDADLVVQSLGNLAAAVALDLLDIDLGEDGGHAPRVVTSAGERPAFEGLVGCFDRGLPPPCVGAGPSRSPTGSGARPPAIRRGPRPPRR